MEKDFIVNIWDTYVKKRNGGIMHFDIVVPEEETNLDVIYNYGKEYLTRKRQMGIEITSDQCRLCHQEAMKPAWSDDIELKGYYIIEVEGCD